ncbi:MAG: OmpA family protein, partial [Bdellovibrionales bacterium]|nr:OmpA family protein [Bdellovibrionales bacterium]
MSEENNCPKCPECPPPGLPGWMATFSDLITLLLTFFVLLLSFAKTESAKYEAALGSIRNAFGGNVLKQGEVLQPGKSPDNQPVMMESAEIIKPFPIDFLTMEGMFDKHEINRESAEDLDQMKSDLKEFDLQENVTIYEMPEGIKVRINDKIYFKKGSVQIEDISVEVFEKVVKLLSNKGWTLFIEGHASKGETSSDGSRDAFILSSLRAAAVAKTIIRRGVQSSRVSSVFYGDSRPERIPGKSELENQELSRRVDFILRKTDLRDEGRAVPAQ